MVIKIVSLFSVATQKFITPLAIALISSLIVLVPLSAAQAAYRFIDAGGLPTRWQSKDESGITAIRYAIATKAVALRADSDEGRIKIANQDCKVTNAPSASLHNSKLSYDDLRQALKLALQLWEGAAPLRFIAVYDVEQADLVIGEGELGLVAAAGLEVIPQPQDGFAEIKRGIVCLSRNEGFAVMGTEAKWNLTRVLAHEIGHVLGLDHPSVSQERAIRENIFMDYRKEGIRPGLAPLSPLDVAGIQALYGDFTSGLVMSSK